MIKIIEKEYSKIVKITYIWVEAKKDHLDSFDFFGFINFYPRLELR